MQADRAGNVSASSPPLAPSDYEGGGGIASVSPEARFPFRCFEMHHTEILRLLLRSPTVDILYICLERSTSE